MQVLNMGRIKLQLRTTWKLSVSPTKAVHNGSGSFGEKQGGEWCFLLTAHT